METRTINSTHCPTSTAPSPSASPWYFVTYVFQSLLIYHFFDIHLQYCLCVFVAELFASLLSSLESSPKSCSQVSRQVPKPKSQVESQVPSGQVPSKSFCIEQDTEKLYFIEILKPVIATLFSLWLGLQVTCCKSWVESKTASLKSVRSSLES